MPLNQDYIAFIQDQLAGIHELDAKKMFGGMGFFSSGKMFGMVTSKNEFRLKVDDTNREAYESRGMTPLKSKNGKRHMPYWTVPEEVLQDKALLREWATRSIAIALKAK